MKLPDASLIDDFSTRRPRLAGATTLTGERDFLRGTGHAACRLWRFIAYHPTYGGSDQRVEFFWQ
ncbi:hypothetical protein [Chromobacterium subtsugae]|uniref:hypothetical protein n=1 Tax=Chromobacterium subtsugae TaxID=251747 RepID=UPI0006417AF0|nr:hypothetical protein [Chromobacterium subtsugae]